jgi:hypothetical protein
VGKTKPGPIPSVPHPLPVPYDEQGEPREVADPGVGRAVLVVDLGDRPLDAREKGEPGLDDQDALELHVGVEGAVRALLIGRLHGHRRGQRDGADYFFDRETSAFPALTGRRAGEVGRGDAIGSWPAE